MSAPKAKKKTSKKAEPKSKKAAAPKVRIDRFMGTADEIATPDELEDNPLVDLDEKKPRRP
jgi:hypothetical protein